MYWPAFIIDGDMVRLEYLKAVYDLQMSQQLEPITLYGSATSHGYNIFLSLNVIQQEMLNFLK